MQSEQATTIGLEPLLVGLSESVIVDSTVSNVRLLFKQVRLLSDHCFLGPYEDCKQNEQETENSEHRKRNENSVGLYGFWLSLNTEGMQLLLGYHAHSNAVLSASTFLVRRNNSDSHDCASALVFEHVLANFLEDERERCH